MRNQTPRGWAIVVVLGICAVVGTGAAGQEREYPSIPSLPSFGPAPLPAGIEVSKPLVKPATGEGSKPAAPPPVAPTQPPKPIEAAKNRPASAPRFQFPWFANTSAPKKPAPVQKPTTGAAKPTGMAKAPPVQKPAPPPTGEAQLLGVPPYRPAIPLSRPDAAPVQTASAAPTSFADVPHFPLAAETPGSKPKPPLPKTLSKPAPKEGVKLASHQAAADVPALPATSPAKPAVLPTTKPTRTMEGPKPADGIRVWPMNVRKVSMDGQTELPPPKEMPQPPLPWLTTAEPEYCQTGCQFPAMPRHFPTVFVTGAFQADAGWFQQSTLNRLTVGDAEDGAAFQRARLGAFGAVAENIDYWLEMDFAFPGRPTFTDVYFDIHQVPYLGNIRVGQWKQFIGLETLTSFRFNPFMERASIFLFNPYRHIGIGFYDYSDDERFTWAGSIYRAGQDQFGNDLADNAGTALAARFTFNPLYENQGQDVLHFGIAYNLAGPSNDRLQFGALGGNAPEFGMLSGTIGATTFSTPPNTPSFVNTGIINSNLYQVIALESAWVYGPLSVQGELNLVPVNRADQSDPFFWGGYLYSTYFLTGENRVYDRRSATFGRIMPRTEFNPLKTGSWCGGAWEVGVRLSYIDCSDRDLDGGRLLDTTLALNWYLNPYTKISFNYIHAFLHRGISQGSNADIYAIRGQIDF